MNPFCCLLSILNFDRRIAAHIGNRKQIIRGKEMFMEENSLNRIILGAIPNVTKSENESNCFPNSLCAFRKRAASPSKKSNKAPRRIKLPLRKKLSSNINMIEDNPQNKLLSVIIFGIFLLIVFISAKI